MWWYLTRSTGIVATILLCLSLVDGLLFSARETPRLPKPNWWLDLHNMLGGLTFGFTVAHIAAVVVDPDAGFNIVEALVPGTVADQPMAIGYGIVAAYLLAVVVATSWPRLRFRRRVWRLIHLLSIPAGILTVVHAMKAGSDAQARWFQVLMALLCGAFLYPAILRGVNARSRRADRKTRATVAHIPDGASRTAVTSAQRSSIPRSVDSVS